MAHQAEQADGQQVNWGDDGQDLPECGDRFDEGRMQLSRSRFRWEFARIIISKSDPDIVKSCRQSFTSDVVVDIQATDAVVVPDAWIASVWVGDGAVPVDG
jgi:hypothetical protein